MTIKLYLIGMGGTGSFLLAPVSKFLMSRQLNNFTLGSVVLIDGDTYSQDNLMRQFFPPSCVGMNKAAAQKMILDYLLKSVDYAPVVDAVAEFITTENIDQVFVHNAHMPVVISMVDNHDCRSLVSQYFKQQREEGVIGDYLLITTGNEKVNGSCAIEGYLYSRPLGTDLLARHPEMLTDKSGTREGLSCLELAMLSGGEQTMAANILSAITAYSLLYEASTIGGVHDNTWLTGLQDVYFDLSPINIKGIWNNGQHDTASKQSLD